MRHLFFMFLISGMLILNGCGNNAFEFTANDSSTEACRYEVSRNLDSGNWDAVINSSCADPMQKGAAYFGRAGFDTVDVVNRLIDARNIQNTSNLYLKTLVTTVTDRTLSDLNSSALQFRQVINDPLFGKDAQFNISIVKAMESLALMKAVIDEDGNGIISDCDLNGNNTPDEVDITVCSLLVEAGQPCTGVTVTQTASDITIENKPGTYRGLILTVGTSQAGCQGEYRRLLYKDQSNSYHVAVTTAGACKESSPDPSRTWPCPVIWNNAPLGMAYEINDAIDIMIENLNSALPGVSNDVVTSIEDIRNDVCGADNLCTAQDIASYLDSMTIQ